ncbi:MAG: UDP-N-acetylglucosamine 2-epimerase (non-hydrolyzing) [Candidatus Brockarchaeota archaeon]|nr:UDP-N-acetylglucosamine 2-epimerase (non-hydrolyzing) [Candidatus Brockarchaeota archaeon]
MLVGTRPEIVKMAPLVREFERRGVPFNLVHSGQHHDYEMSGKFFEELELPRPDFKLGIKASTPAGQTGEAMVGVERIARETGPKLVLVQGDTNTTLAGALAAAKSKVPIGHVEAGLRSYDLRMQEEHNRRVVDHLSSYLFAPTRLCKKILLGENVWGKVSVTGNTVIDACIQHAPIAERKSKVLERLRFKRYALATLHRAENVDDPKVLKGLAESMMEAPLPIVMPVHPRTEKRLKEQGLWKKFSTHENVELLPPVGYLDFLALMMGSALILTDSGGVQEEATSPPIRKRVLVLRLSTERPEAVRAGFATVVGTEKGRILEKFDEALRARKGLPASSPFGDGNAAGKIVEILSAQGCL